MYTHDSSINNTFIDLSAEEPKNGKDDKRQLKAELKRHRKIDKLEKRIRHAIQGKNQLLESQARKELQEFLLEKFPTSRRDIASEPSPSTYNPLFFGAIQAESQYEDTKQFIIGICNRIIQQSSTCTAQQVSRHNKDIINNESVPGKEESQGKNIVREKQTKDCRVLMRQMSTGTQTKESFRQSHYALWGYTRQKFLERALLVCTSLSKLNGCSADNMGFSMDTNRRETTCWKQLLMWERLQKVTHACSIGSGPGNDLTGLVAYLRQQRQNSNPQRQVLQTAVALDWVEDEWQCVMKPLRKILTPHFIKSFTSQSCDITHPLITGDGSPCTINCAALEYAVLCDIFLVSYLLTENRGNWEVFFSQLFQLVKPGSLFYFAEPTSWQLQKLLKMASLRNNDNMLDDTDNTSVIFLWLDSSFGTNLQEIDGRLGPAVLLGMKTK